jgi:hypothetical protein
MSYVRIGLGADRTAIGETITHETRVGHCFVHAWLLQREYGPISRLWGTEPSAPVEVQFLYSSTNVVGNLVTISVSHVVQQLTS